VEDRQTEASEVGSFYRSSWFTGQALEYCLEMAVAAQNLSVGAQASLFPELERVQALPAFLSSAQAGAGAQAGIGGHAASSGGAGSSSSSSSSSSSGSSSSSSSSTGTADTDTGTSGTGAGAGSGDATTAPPRPSHHQAGVDGRHNKQQRAARFFQRRRSKRVLRTALQRRRSDVRRDEGEGAAAGAAGGPAGWGAFSADLSCVNLPEMAARLHSADPLHKMESLL